MNRVSLLLLSTLACGCSKSDPAGSPISLEPQVKVVHAQPRTVVRTVGQPGVIAAYERTAMYAKVAGYVDKWYVDEGDRVPKGKTMVELAAPDLVERHKQMQALAAQDRVLVDQARQLVGVADSTVAAAAAMVAQALADVKRYQADVDRWDSEVKRLTVLVKDRVLDQQVLDETRRQLFAGQAALEASRQAVKTRDAQRLALEAALEKAKVDVNVALAKVKVSDAEERRLAAIVGYLTITAPYDGIVFARNVNTGDFVQPASGDPSEGNAALGVAPSRATPMYVFFRVDPMLFIVGVPEGDARYVVPGSKARVRIPSLSREVEAQVTRTSNALNSTSRTLIAQIELPNPKGDYRPGTYAYGSVHIERNKVRAVPVSSITEIGNHSCCYLVVNGKAVKTRVQIGLSDGAWVEVAAKLVPRAGSAEENWQPFDGTEAVIDGDLGQLSDGESVRVLTEK